MNEINQATDDSSLRASLIELDLDGPPPVAPVVTQALATVEETGSLMPTAKIADRVIVPGVTIDQENVRRCLADQEAAKAAGFTLKDPIYQIGTSVNEVGVANFTAARKEWDAKATVAEACANLINQVNKENRRDLVLDVPTLAMTSDGNLVIPGAGSLPLSQRALEGLTFHTVQAGAKYLSECPASLRAQNFNHWFPLAYRKDKRASDKATDGQDIHTAKRVTLRTRENAEGDRSVFSVCGPRYTSFDVNALASKIYGRLAGLGDARADVIYDGYKLRFDMLWETDVQPQNAAAGEIFHAGMVLRTADDGSGAISVAVELERNLCLNRIVLSFDKILVGKRRHQGKDTDIDSKLNEFFDTVHEKLGYFASAWSAGATENMIERYGVSNPRELFSGLVLNKVVGVPGVSDEDMVARLMRAYEKEPGFSKTAFLNAITRASHEETWESWSTCEELEETAGSLLFQKNWNCIPPKDKTIADVLGGF